MKVVIPTPLTVLSNTVPETDAADGPEWDAATTYGPDDVVRRHHVRYKSIIIGANKGADPETSHDGLTAKWRRLGMTNRHALLDDFLNTQTVARGETSLTFSVPFSRCTSFALLNMDAAEVHVKVCDDTGDVFYENHHLMTADLTSFSAFQYCFYPISAGRDIVATEVPMPILGTLEVTLTATENPAIGQVVCGRSHSIGQTQHDAEVGETDYSRRQTDQFGVTTFVKGASAGNMDLNIYLHPERSDAVNRILSDLRATPALWVGDNSDQGHQALTIWGWREDFRLRYAGPNNMELRLSVQGLI
ncbi:hypothetical protein [Alistipes communis]|uniref:hypothetical protein n=1 Tax=Alistipes communis TaxID=2585118 RepID=UPI003AB6797B